MAGRIAQTQALAAGRNPIIVKDTLIMIAKIRKRIKPERIVSCPLLRSSGWSLPVAVDPDTCANGKDDQRPAVRPGFPVACGVHISQNRIRPIITRMLPGIASPARLLSPNAMVIKKPVPHPHQIKGHRLSMFKDVVRHSKQSKDTNNDQDATDNNGGKVSVFSVI